MPPAVSIILPVYNGQKYLRQSLDSVLAQTWREFELIVCDDASSDQSARIMAGCDDPRVRRLNNSTNQGLFRSLNRAIGHASGTWIKLWTQDDMMKPRCLEASLSLEKRYPDVAMVYTARDIIDEEGAIRQRHVPDTTPEYMEPALASKIMFYHGSIAGNISNVMIRRAVLAELGLFREDLRVSGDFDMWVRIAERHPLGFVGESLLYLRRHNGQFSRAPGIYPTFMREDEPIYRTLLSRLPPKERQYAWRYHRCHRYRQYAHHFVRCLAVGDFRTAAATYRAMRSYDHPLLLLGLWLFTVNGRLFRMKSRYLEEHAARQSCRPAAA